MQATKQGTCHATVMSLTAPGERFQVAEMWVFARFIGLAMGDTRGRSPVFIARERAQCCLGIPAPGLPQAGCWKPHCCPGLDDFRREGRTQGAVLRLKMVQPSVSQCVRLGNGPGRC